MAEIKRTLEGASQEIYRLCERIKELESDNRFLTEQLMAVGEERKFLRREVRRLTGRATNASWESEALRSQISANHEMGQ
jgi:chromosome segregation ATPase